MSPCNVLLLLFFHLGSASGHIALYRTVTEQPICTGPTGPAGIVAFHFHFHKYSKTFRSYNESARVGQEKMTSSSSSAYWSGSIPIFGSDCIHTYRELN